MTDIAMAVFITGAILAFPIYTVFFSTDARATRRLKRENRLLESMNAAIASQDEEAIKQILQQTTMEFTYTLGKLYLQANQKVKKSLAVNFSRTRKQ